MIRILTIVIFLVILIVFALSNTDPVPVWFTTLGWQVPVGTSALGLATFSLFLGLLLGWLGEFRQRRRARRAESQLRTLEKQQGDTSQELERVKAQLLLSTQPAQPVSSQPVSSRSGAKMAEQPSAPQLSDESGEFQG